MTAPVLTAESFEEGPDGLTHELSCLLEQFPGEAAAILSQTIQLAKNPPRLPNELAKLFIKLDTLKQLFFRPHDEVDVILKIARLSLLFPSKKDTIASLLLHLDIFMALLQSETSSTEIVKTFLEIFPEHGAGLAIVLSSPTVLQEVKQDPELAQCIVQSFSKLLDPSLVEELHKTFEESDPSSRPDAPSSYSP